MLKKLKGIFSVLLVALIVTLSAAPAFAVQTYPEGITKEQTLSVISKSDILISELLKSTENKTLRELILPEIYNDNTLSALTVSLYAMIEENAESLSAAGLKLTVSDVSACLSDYPDVQKKLSENEKWSAVKLDGARWNIKSKKDFVKAMGCILSPFNDLLYMLLCNGTYSLNKIIGVAGDYGYEKAIIPTLEALGCKDITPAKEFYSDSEKNKSSITENIVSDVLTLFEDSLDTPCDSLTDILPSVAYFLNNGGFDSVVAKLIEPLRLQIFNIKTFIKIETILSFIQNSEEYTQSFTLNFNDIMAGTGLKMAEIKLDELASCGTASDNGFVPDKADAFLVMIRWIIETAKLNKDSLSTQLPDEITELLNGAINKPTDELVALYISLLTQTQGKALDYVWTAYNFTPSSVTYTPNLTADQYQRVVDGVDDLINEFIAEGGVYKNTEEALKPMIYSNAVITEIAKMLYSAFEDEKMQSLCNLIGLNVTTYGVANLLNGNSYSTARYTLYRAEKWSSLKDIEWGFKDGNKKAFVNTLCDVLSPLEPILNALLAEGKIILFGAVDFYGSNGYNTAVIPVLEVLGCESKSMKTYEEYKKSVSKGDGIKAIIDPVTGLIDRIIEKPVYTAAEILPNILWFIKNKGIDTAIENLLYPLTSVMKELGAENLLDLSDFGTDIDLNKILSDMLKETDLGIDISKLDIMQFAVMGQSTTVQSKRTTNGQPQTVQYIKADKPAIAVTLLRFVAEFMKTPGNEDMMLSMMGSEEDSMMMQFSGGLGEELEKMTTDETVEWLYKLFFRERVVEEIKVTEKYLPTIDYEPQKKGGNGLIYAVAVVAVVGIVTFAFVKKRKKNTEIEEDDECLQEV